MIHSHNILKRDHGCLWRRARTMLVGMLHLSMKKWLAATAAHAWQMIFGAFPLSAAVLIPGAWAQAQHSGPCRSAPMPSPCSWQIHKGAACQTRRLLRSWTTDLKRSGVYVCSKSHASLRQERADPSLVLKLRTALAPCLWLEVRCLMVTKPHVRLMRCQTCRVCKALRHQAVFGPCPFLRS